MIKAHIGQNWGVGGVEVTLFERRGDEAATVYYFEGGTIRREQVDYGVVTTPSFTLPDEFARALLDALLRHFEGATDLHTVRGDLLHERGRVDNLIDVLKRIALDMAGK